MNKCPWYGKGATGCGSPGSGGHVKYNNALCQGHQINNQTYKNCPYYVNKQNVARFTGRPCPQCVVKRYSNSYMAYCVSAKNPGTDGGTVMTKNGIVFDICAEGRQVRGQKYTACPFYQRGTNKVIQNARKKQNEKEKARVKIKKIIWIIVIAYFVLRIIAYG